MRLVILVLALFLEAISLAAALADDEYVFIVGARGNPYWQALADGVQDTARRRGIEATVYQIKDDSGSEEQLNVCLTAVVRRPKLIAMSSVTPNVGIQCFKAAMTAGIPVADLDAHLLPDEAKKEGVELLFSVGSDNYLIGQNAARHVAKNVEKKQPRILVLEGTSGGITSEKRARGFRDEIKKVLPQAVIVASVTADFDRLRALNITNDILVREPELDVVYAVNDLMALGAAEASRISARPTVKIIGVDGIADARKAVLAGKLHATVAQLPYLIGVRAVELALAPPSDKLVVTPTPVLDRKTLTENKEDVLRYLR